MDVIGLLARHGDLEQSFRGRGLAGLTLARAAALEHTFMGEALALARNGSPAPNPHVGAVLVRGARIVGEGFHERAGAAHAEAVAIARAGGLARGATLYVTLEPCNHVGRTPPCVDAILRAGIERVVIGCLDPNHRVLGGGATRLAAAGVDVVLGVRELEAAHAIADWVASLAARTG